VDGDSGAVKFPLIFEARRAPRGLCGLGIDVLSEVVTTWACTATARRGMNMRGMYFYTHAMTRV
jgi:hypothetical protein